jgi:hypothetical protein
VLVALSDIRAVRKVVKQLQVGAAVWGLALSWRTTTPCVSIPRLFLNGQLYAVLLVLRNTYLTLLWYPFSGERRLFKLFRFV